jgi:hypothetical protein
MRCCKLYPGRLDLLVLPIGDERMAVVVEIKSAQWDERRPERIRPDDRPDSGSCRATVISEIGGKWHSAAGVLVYPRRPLDPNVTELITRMVDSEALMLVW